MTTVTLNGRSLELPEQATVAMAVRESGLPPNGSGVAVAVDGEVVPRGEWGTRDLRQGERVEVLHAVQGG